MRPQEKEKFPDISEDLDSINGYMDLRETARVRATLIQQILDI